LIYFFEDFSLDSDRRELRRGTKPIAVEPLVFDLLEYLIRNRDRVVSKDDLIAGVWRGRIVSESTLASRLNAARHAVGDSGEQQRLIRTISRKGRRFVGEVREEQSPRHGSGQVPAKQDETSPPMPSDVQAISFCRTKDGVNLAVATVGNGPVLVVASYWLGHVEHDWHNLVVAPWLHRLSRTRRLVRYDCRGSGLSDRNVSDMSLETFRDDLEAVVDSLQLQQFCLLGVSAGAALAIAYAARHRQRVSKLALAGGYALGRNKRGSSQTADEAKAFITMLRSGWGDNKSLFWRSYVSFFLPSASPEQLESWLDYMRAGLAIDAAELGRTAQDNIDVHDLLPLVRAPTIVFHSVRDKLVPFEQGRVIASSIPNAKFVALDSENHVLLPQEPAFAKYMDELDAFLAEGN
jgi:pimeloyl-ACP methyl ester carboxylesterase/DNA-binding winged helix-turn-helix (wHTH) protein